MRQALVSVIVPVFNRAKMLADAIASVKEQHHRPIQLIVVDDGSSDDTHQVAAQLLSEIGEAHFHTELIRIDNAGPGLARQAGLELARGDYIQYLDSDDLLHPEKLSTQVSALQQHEDCGVAYCKQQLCAMDGELIEAAWMRSGEQHKTMFPAMLGGRLWGTPVPLYRAELLHRAGPWTNLHSQEDWEYDCRVAALDVKMIYHEQTWVTIRQHQASHFGQLDAVSKDRKLTDRAAAYQLINDHAIRAGVCANQSEFEHFRRMSFHLIRQLGSASLSAPAQRLFNSVLRSPKLRGREKLRYTVYQLLASVFGWDRLGAWSTQIDRRRA